MKNNLISSLAGLPKFTAGFVGTMIFRLLSPFLGLWNVSPLMATELSGAKAYGPLVGGLYGFLSMIFLDMLMGKLSDFSLITAGTYAAVGIWGSYFMKNRVANSRNFVVASIVGTLFFDLVTGVLVGPLFFGQVWMVAIVGQIPFTLRHMAGNVFFASILAPWFYRKIMDNPKWEFRRVFKFA